MRRSKFFNNFQVSKKFIRRSIFHDVSGIIDVFVPTRISTRGFDDRTTKIQFRRILDLKKIWRKDEEFEAKKGGRRLRWNPSRSGQSSKDSALELASIRNLWYTRHYDLFKKGIRYKKNIEFNRYE